MVFSNGYKNFEMLNDLIQNANFLHICEYVYPTFK